MHEVIHHPVNPITGVCLTPAAVSHAVSYLQKQPQSLGIRLSVKKTGCSGFSYVVDYVVEGQVQAEDKVFRLNDRYNVYLDKASYPYLKGMTMDYVKQGFNAKWVFNNPNERGQCGCGESFTVE